MKDFKENIGSVETIRLVLNCISSKDFNHNNKSRSYIGFYEDNPDFGKVYKVDNLN